MIRKALAGKLFEGFSIQRWNEKVRPVELTEMDKNAHKMMIAWCLGRAEEDAGNAVDWDKLIRGGIYELLRRIVISDIKSPIFKKIRDEHPDVFQQLNEWTADKLSAILEPRLLEDFRGYLAGNGWADERTTLILRASHLYATWCEFQIIRQASPDGYQVREIERNLLNRMEPFLDLKGMRQLVTRQKLADFAELCGQLRFQVRWGQTPRVPSTSVLGHMMCVATFSWFFLEELKACDRRRYNAFFGGLFHDLPEVVTRDIISPVKSAVDELPDVIGSIEQELVAEEIHGLLDASWIPELQYFTENEFDNKVRIDGEIRSVEPEDIPAKYDDVSFDPYDGSLMKAADHFAAYLEAYKSKNYGITSEHIESGLRLKNLYENKILCGLNLAMLYADFT